MTSLSLHIDLVWILLSGLPLLFLSCTFIILGQFSLWVKHFYETLHGLSFEDEEAIQLHTWHLCMNWIMDAQWPVTDRLWKKWCHQLVIVMCICYLCRDFWTEELAAQVAFYAIIVNILWELKFVMLGDWCYLNCGIWNWCISNLWKARVVCIW